MNFKLAILAAAAVGAATTAQAADLAKKAPAAANYVKVCDAMGAGFFYIPGSDTCLKIGGYIRAQYYGYGNNDAWNDGSYNGIGAAGIANGGHRRQNNIGTFARFELDVDARTATEYGLLRSFAAVQFDFASGGPTATTLDKGFIQFGGLTAGHAQSMFDFFTGSTVGVYEPAHSDTSTNLLAYTFAFGNGFSATVSLEDPSTGGRRFSNVGTWYGGVKTPDAILALQVEQAWGKAKLAGALHDDYGIQLGTVKKSEVGFAILGGVEVKLGAADVIDLQATYVKGALGYLFANTYAGVVADDFAYVGNSLKQTTGYAVAGSWTHQWTKTVATAFEASYAKVDYDNNVTNTWGYSDYSQLDLIANVSWKPVTNLTFMLEGDYRAIDYSVKGIDDPHGFIGIIRVQRDF
jgi:hypothetical protein